MLHTMLQGRQLGTGRVYELHVGETTRPVHAQALKAFEDTFLSKVEESVKTNKWKHFDTAYRKAVVGCNACQASSGHGYIRYKLPSTPPQFLNLPAK